MINTMFPAVVLDLTGSPLPADARGETVHAVRRRLSGLNLSVLELPPPRQKILGTVTLCAAAAAASDAMPGAQGEPWVVDLGDQDGLVAGAGQVDAQQLAGAIEGRVNASLRWLIQKGAVADIQGLAPADRKLLQGIFEQEPANPEAFTADELFALNALLPGLIPRGRGAAPEVAVAAGGIAAAAVEPAGVVAAESAGVAEGAAMQSHGGLELDGSNLLDLYDIYQNVKELKPSLWGDLSSESLDSSQALGAASHDSDVAEFFDLEALSTVAGSGPDGSAVAELLGGDVDLSEAADGEVVGEILSGLGELVVGLLSA